MAEQIIDGIFNGVRDLGILGVGCVLFWIGKYLVEEWGSESSSSKGLPKWKATLIVLVIGVILGVLVATPSAVREGGDPLFGGGEVTEVIEVKRPYEAFAWMFVFSCVVMWVGVSKGEGSRSLANHRVQTDAASQDPGGDEEQGEPRRNA